MLTSKALVLGLLGGGATFDLYVDSVGGNDINSGRNPAQALRTLAAAQVALSASQRLGLARGSNWREQFDVLVTNLRIGVYSTGAMPIIDGSDLAGAWTQPDVGTYPDVWSQAWTRAAVGTVNEPLGLWLNGARPSRLASSLDDLQTNGGWHTTSLTAQSSTISVKSATDPNISGDLYEIGKRSHAFNGHLVTLLATRTANYVGPIELKRCLGHYNAGSFGPGSAKKMFVRDGTIHHITSAAELIEDVLATEYSPQVGPSVIVCYRAEGTGFNPVINRCGVLLLGGASRVNGSAFYAHSSNGTALADSLTVQKSFCRGVNANSPGAVISIAEDIYVEDVYQIGLGATATTNTFRRVLLKDSVSGGAAVRAMRRLSANALLVEHCAFFLKGGYVFENQAVGGLATLNNCALADATDSQGGIFGGSVSLNSSVIHSRGRVMDQLAADYIGNFNVFYRTGSTGAGTGPGIYWNGTLYNNALSVFTAASGQDANSVNLWAVDQTASNPNAFWLGVSTGVNSGPVDGDFRINPSAKVRSGNDTIFTGTFADGVTPITLAGPQEQWDWNQKAVVAGPPSRFPTLPTTIAEMRAYVDNPSSWNFYP